MIIISIIFILLICIFYYINSIIKIETFQNLEDTISYFFNDNNVQSKKKIIPLVINSDLVPEEEYNKKQIINISKRKENKSIYVISYDNKKYIFYNNNQKPYMYVVYNNVSNIDVYNNENKFIGKSIFNEYNKFNFRLEENETNTIHIDFYNNYNNAKIYLDNDNKYFYIKKDDNNQYSIYVFDKLIGKIILSKNKIVVYDEFKIYLNIFGITYVLIQKLLENF